MRTNVENPVSLYKAIAQFQSGGQTVEKDKRNEFLRYNYATYESLVTTINPILVESGLIFMHGLEGSGMEWFREITMPNPKDDGKGELIKVMVDYVRVSTRVIHADSGEWVEVADDIPVTPMKGLSMAQAKGVIESYNKRYQLMALLGLVSEDTDGTSGDGINNKQPASKNSLPPARQQPSPRLSNTQQHAAQPAKQEPQKQEPPKQQPPAQPARQTAPAVEKPAGKPAQDLDAIINDFGEGLNYWLANGWNKDSLDAIGKAMTSVFALSSDDPDNWIADDYLTFMARMDLECATKDWAAKGITQDGIQAMVEGLFEAKEINAKFIDQLNEAGYKTVIDVIDADLGISKNG